MIIYIKMDLALNNLKRLICHKTKKQKQPPISQIVFKINKKLFPSWLSREFFSTYIVDIQQSYSSTMYYYIIAVYLLWDESRSSGMNPGRRIPIFASRLYNINIASNYYITDYIFCPEVGGRSIGF